MNKKEKEEFKKLKRYLENVKDTVEAKLGVTHHAEFSYCYGFHTAICQVLSKIKDIEGVIK